MKKLNVKLILIFTLLAALTVLPAGAQDVITRRDGSEIMAVVREVGTNEVKFIYWNDLQGPVHVIPASDILMIRYQNGHSEVFPAGQKVLDGMAPAPQVSGTPSWSSIARPGMEYSEYKDYYDPHIYTPRYTDPYSRAWAGAGSFLLTGLGQGIDGEWARAGGFFAAYWGFRLAAWATADYVDFDNGYHVNYSGISALLRLGATAVKVWSIFNAVRVAKIKNMYYQDLHKGYSGTGFDVKPFLTCTPEGTAGVMQPAAGLSLCMKF